MKITEYKKITRTEKQGYRTYYEYTVDGLDRKLCEEYLELCGGYRNCHIIQIENENWLGYYDTEEEVIYIDPLGGYPGISKSKKIVETLTQHHLKWDDYKVYVHYYDFDESVLAIRKQDKDTTFEERIFNATIGNYLKD